MNVLVTFGGLSWQKGSAAQLESFIEVARSIEPDVDIVLESHSFDLDAPRARDLGIGIVGHAGTVERSPHEGSVRLAWVRAKLILWSALKRLGCDVAWLVRDQVAQAVLKADLVVDLSGDSYRDRPGGLAIAHNLFVLSAVWCGKRVAIVSQSLGPFKWYSRTLTRFCLDRTHHIYIREQQTSDLLRKLHVKPERFALAPDLAFCLSAATADRAEALLPQQMKTRLGSRRDRPIVGISVSSLVRGLKTDGGRAYMANMARIIGFLRRRYDAVILLVPHVVTPAAWGDDDVSVAHELAEIAKPQAEVFVLSGDPTAAEIKAVISRCDLFLAARMHAAIAALSSDVPTLMLSWSHKYSGLMEQLGLQRLVWDVESPVEQLELLIAEGWAARDRIRELLRSYNWTAQEMVRREMQEVLRIVSVASHDHGRVAEARHTKLNQPA